MANTAPSFVNVSAQVAANTSPQTVTLPASTVTGDWLLIVCIQASAAAVTFASSGYASIARNSNATRSMTIDVLKKVHSGSESNPSVTCDAAAGGWAVQMVAYRGVLAEDAADVSSDAAAAQTFQPTQITTVVDNSMVISFAGTKDDNALTYNNQNSFSDRMSGANYDGTAGNGSDYSVGWADIVKVSHGAQTMPTWNQSANGNDVWVALSIALAPPTDLTLTVTGEQMTQSDAEAQVLAIALPITGESITFSEAVSLAFTGLGITGESITWTDAKTLLFEYQLPKSDSFTITEATTLGYGFSISDSFTLTDSASEATTGLVLSDSFTITDTAALLFGYRSASSDSITFLDAATTELFIVVVEAADSITFDDAFSKTLDIVASGSLSVAATDSVTFLDALATSLDIFGLVVDLTAPILDAAYAMSETVVVRLTTPQPPVMRVEWRGIYSSGGSGGWSRRTMLS